MFQIPFGPTNRSEPFDEQVIEADVLERELIDEGVFKKLLRRGGRRLAIPAVEGLELLWVTKPTPKCGSQCMRR